MAFNGNTRVKIQAIFHLTRLGYTYLSLKGASWNEDDNIIPDIFNGSILYINQDKNLEIDDGDSFLYS